MNRTAIRRHQAEYNRLLKESDEAYRLAARKFSLSETSLWILYFLRSAPGCTQRELCASMLQPKQSVNTALKKLAGEGLIRLEANPDDRRSKSILLTEAGQRLADATAGRIIAAEEAAFAALPEEDRRTFLRIYADLVGSLCRELRRL